MPSASGREPARRSALSLDAQVLDQEMTSHRADREPSGREWRRVLEAEDQLIVAPELSLAVSGVQANPIRSIGLEQKTRFRQVVFGQQWSRHSAIVAPKTRRGVIVPPKPHVVRQQGVILSEPTLAGVLFRKGSV